jgi:signal transduction histidine kinase
MASSFRRRLLAIAALTIVVCGAAVAAILLLAGATEVERIDRARENVVHEVEGLRAVLEDVPPVERKGRERQSGQLRSGYTADSVVVDPEPLVAEAVARAARAAAPVVLDRADGSTPILVAAAPVSGGGYAFALQRVVAGRETKGLRVVVVALALLSLGLVVAALRTLAAVEQGVSSLRASLSAVAKDLKSPVERPPLRELGEVAGGIAALAEELDRAQEERQRLTRELADRERLAALGRVAAGIAHEVRNPLAAMKLRADLARAGGEATPAVARDLEDIGAEIARLDRLVSDLLGLAGRGSAPRTEVDVGDLVARRVALLTPWAAVKGVRLAGEGTGHARADADALARAIDNLLRNGVEASPGGASVAVTVRQEGTGVVIEVMDAGSGVPPARTGELFEPFFTTKAEGTGLGLALARAVAMAHSGTLTYARDADRTRFTLTLR